MLDAQLSDAELTSYAELEERLRSWALAQPEILAVVIVGSRARHDHPADRWSDLDLVAFISGLSNELTQINFPNAFGSTLLSVLDRTGHSDPEWLIVYEDGLKLDIVFVVVPQDHASSSNLQQWIDAGPYRSVFRRGVRLLIDKSETPTEKLISHAPAQPLSLPDETELDKALQKIFLDCMRSAKYLARNECWRAQQVCDCVLKQQLLVLLEWQSQTNSATRLDVWHDGRYLSEWVDPETLARLPATYGGFDQYRLGPAILSTFDLSSQIAQQIAGSLGVSYPIERETRTRALLQEILP